MVVFYQRQPGPIPGDSGFVAYFLGAPAGPGMQSYSPATDKTDPKSIHLQE
jgi:hypothetical protein